MARQYPDRIAGVIGVNTPDLPRSPVPPVALLRQIFVEDPNCITVELNFRAS